MQTISLLENTVFSVSLRFGFEQHVWGSMQNNSFAPWNNPSKAKATATLIISVKNPHCPDICCTKVNNVYELNSRILVKQIIIVLFFLLVNVDLPVPIFVSASFTVCHCDNPLAKQKLLHTPTNCGIYVSNKAWLAFNTTSFMSR